MQVKDFPSCQALVGLAEVVVECKPTSDVLQCWMQIKHHPWTRADPPPPRVCPEQQPDPPAAFLCFPQSQIL